MTSDLIGTSNKLYFVYKYFFNEISAVNFLCLPFAGLKEMKKKKKNSVKKHICQLRNFGGLDAMNELYCIKVI